MEVATTGLEPMMLLGGERVDSLEAYHAGGGLEGYATSEALGPEGVVDRLEASGLRGRGGAGFPAGVKWRSIMAGRAGAGERFVVANGAEGEPGTFKDRAIIRHNAYALIEGLLIAARTLGARRAFIALKASFEVEAERVAVAAAEFVDAGLAADVSIELVRGPDEYLYGEEKALLEVIEGEDPLPRLFPPYIYGLFTTSPQVGWSAGARLDDPSRAGANPTPSPWPRTVTDWIGGPQRHTPSAISRTGSWLTSTAASWQSSRRSTTWTRRSTQLTNW